MIIATRQYGQLGNRLRLYAHLMAAAIEYDVTLCFPHMREYAQYFPSLREDNWCRYPTKHKAALMDPEIVPSSSRREQFVRWLICKQVYLTARTLSHLRCTSVPAHVIRIVDGQLCDLNTNEIRLKAQSARPLLVAGWGFRSDDLVDKHAQRIREHFQILPAHQRQVDSTIAPLRRPGTKIVGVHIRHGDYQTWKGGAYFFPVKDYASHMRLIAQRNPQTRTRFLVCGNGKLSKDDFPDLDVSFSTGQLIEDMYVLAETDLIIGPPSSYSSWSSFYGGASKLTMLRRNHQSGLFDENELRAVVQSPPQPGTKITREHDAQDRPRPPRGQRCRVAEQQVVMRNP